MFQKLALMVLFLLPLHCAAQVKTFQKIPGWGTFRGIHKTNSGEYIVAGTSGTLGNSQFGLTKLNDTGTVLWSFKYVVDGSSGAYAVTQTTDNGYAVVGKNNGTDAGASIVKTDSIGNVQWSIVSGTSIGDFFGQVVETPDSYLLLGGMCASSGAGNQDFYIVKMNAAGQEVWTKTIGGVATDLQFDLSRTSDDKYLLAGFTNSFGLGGGSGYLIKMDSSGTILWAKGYTGVSSWRSIIETDDHDYLLAGDVFDATGYSQAVIAKTDTSGNIKFAKAIGGLGLDRLLSVKQVDANNYAFAGHAVVDTSGQTDVDAFLFKTDTAGMVHWMKTYGIGQNDYAADLEVTDEKGYMMAGHSAATQVTGKFYIVRTGPSGDAGCYTTIPSFVSQDISVLVSNTTPIVTAGPVAHPFQVTATPVTTDSTLCKNVILSINSAIAKNPPVIFPNPSYGELYLQAEEEGSLEIYNTLGVQVSAYTVNRGRNHLRLPGQLSSGVYIAVFRTKYDSQTHYSRIILNN